MFEVLHEAHALGRLMPSLAGPSADPAGLDHLKASLGRASQHALALPSRFGLLALANQDGKDSKDNAGVQLAAALRAPNDCRDIAQLLVMHGAVLFDEQSLAEQQAAPLAADLLQWIQRFDGLRRPERLPLIMAAANAWSGGQHSRLAKWLELAVRAAQSVDAGPIAKPLAKSGPEAIAAALHEARQQAIENSLMDQ